MTIESFGYGDRGVVVFAFRRVGDGVSRSLALWISSSLWWPFRASALQAAHQHRL